MTPPTKAELRATLKKRWREDSPGDRAQESSLLRERIRTMPPWRYARQILLFAPLPDELDVWPLLRDAWAEGKGVALPAFDFGSDGYGVRLIRDPEAEVVMGRYGIREPGANCPELSLAALDLVLVPGLAFTREGGRLGRGRGVYDRLLKATGAVRVGIARDIQIVPWLPLEPHDAMLDYIVTPSAIHTGGRRPN